MELITKLDEWSAMFYMGTYDTIRIRLRDWRSKDQPRPGNLLVYQIDLTQVLVHTYAYNLFI